MGTTTQGGNQLNTRMGAWWVSYSGTEFHKSIHGYNVTPAEKGTRERPGEQVGWMHCYFRQIKAVTSVDAEG